MDFKKSGVGVYATSDFKPTFWSYLNEVLKAGIESSGKFAAAVKNLQAFLIPVLDNVALKDLKYIAKREKIDLQNAKLHNNAEEKQQILARNARLRLSVLMLLIKRKGFFGIDELGFLEGETEDDTLETEGVELPEVLEVFGSETQKHRRNGTKD